jgi:hypothetical protein
MPAELLGRHVRGHGLITSVVSINHVRTLNPFAGTVARVSSIRMGVLGAARITPTAVITPAREVDDVAVSALAARDPARAAAAAAKWGVPRVLPAYAPGIDD